MGTLGGAGLAAAAGRARTVGMEGDRLASQARSSGLPAGGATGESPGVDAPLLGGSGSSALLQAEVLDLDEDEDDLEVFSKVRAAAAAARPGKVPSQLRELAPWCGGRPQRARPAPAEAPSWRWVGSSRSPNPGRQLAALRAASRPGREPQARPLLHFDLPFRTAVALWSRQSCDFVRFFLFLLSCLTRTPHPDSFQAREAVARECPSLAASFRTQPAQNSGREITLV